MKISVVLLTASTRQDVINRIDEVNNTDPLTEILRKPKPPSEIVKAVLSAPISEIMSRLNVLISIVRISFG
ncbi:MAG: hypothetical protein GY795_19250 [Desulfobacterales bacterium]|nr:hypothetical protein [Desulfobacterales bacterium]